MATLKGQIERLLLDLPRHQWRVVKRGPHYLAYPPDKTKKAVPIPTSPSPSSVRNLTKRLRDGGYDPEREWWQ